MHYQIMDVFNQLNLQNALFYERTLLDVHPFFVRNIHIKMIKKTQSFMNRTCGCMVTIGTVFHSVNIRFCLKYPIK